VKQEKNIESSLTILYDTIRWEEKALYEAAKKRGIKVNRID
jgi:[lysine-biosynthesis-protein LysW]---L-2-aminoadipate ligase